MRVSAPTTAPQPDPELLGAWFDTITEAGRVYEVRITDPRKGGPRRFFGTVAGYFRADPEGRRAFVQMLSTITGADAKAVYLVMNPVKADLLARARNRLN